MEPTPPEPTSLSERERAVLDFERQWWKHAGAKERAILETFDWTATRHAQVLNALLDRPEAEAYDAQLVHRLRRLRDQRARQRSSC